MRIHAIAQGEVGHATAVLFAEIVGDRLIILGSVSEGLQVEE